MKRYEMHTNALGSSMEPSEDGDWVYYEDVEADLTRLRTEREALIMRAEYWRGVALAFGATDTEPVFGGLDRLTTGPEDVK